MLLHFLADEKNGYITGANISINGGHYMLYEKVTNVNMRLIKKYPNRRLYDTELGVYITFEDVKKAGF